LDPAALGLVLVQLLKPFEIELQIALCTTKDLLRLRRDGRRNNIGVALKALQKQRGNEATCLHLCLFFGLADGGTLAAPALQRKLQSRRFGIVLALWMIDDQMRLRSRAYGAAPAAYTSATGGTNG